MPWATAELAWRLRYRKEECKREDLMMAAEIIEAYEHLVLRMPLEEARKRLSAMRKVLLPQSDIPTPETMETVAYVLPNRSDSR